MPQSLLGTYGIQVGALVNRQTLSNLWSLLEPCSVCSLAVSTAVLHRVTWRRRHHILVWSFRPAENLHRVGVASGKMLAHENTVTSSLHQIASCGVSGARGAGQAFRSPYPPASCNFLLLWLICFAGILISKVSTSWQACQPCWQSRPSSTCPYSTVGPLW